MCNLSLKIERLKGFLYSFSLNFDLKFNKNKDLKHNRNKDLKHSKLAANFIII
jgi:hypothetical protein